jgi:hypothetical protein
MTNDSANPTDGPAPASDPTSSLASPSLPPTLQILSPPPFDPAPAFLPPPLIPQPAAPTAANPSIRQSVARPPAASQGTAALAIVMAYLGLGLALAWGIQQGRQRQIAQDRSDRERIAADLIVSQEDDLGRFLAQSGTVSMPMLGLSGGPVTSASVAWNRELRDGRLFCDSLEKIKPPRTCQLWFGGPDGYTCVSRFDPVPGQDIYRFHVDGLDLDPTEIILTRGTPADDFEHVANTDVLARGGRAGRGVN